MFKIMEISGLQLYYLVMFIGIALACYCIHDAKKVQKDRRERNAREKSRMAKVYGTEFQAH